ncbi:molybdate ABC transporter permease subunit [Campylobacter sp. RM9929]|uniref:molybdate ABC transporter permease subunit n=1 Tax=Campylobacter molothri TaxID=1032242 RepID=UPI001DEDBCE2|nr:molybdate ABC transporter permease subunit [Campylobacter sp. RM9929]MBZ7965599.1 molybdate ABC transporter permease subunit [Campylobacter sp. RM10535]
MLDPSFLQTLFLTLKLAFITTFILFFIGIFLAYILSFTRFPFKALLQTCINLPLVLPPSVLGFYLLIAFSTNTFLGEFLQKYFHLSLVFTFEGLVFASIIFSLPFMINPLQSAFSSINQNLLYASYTLGKSKITTLFRVILPNCKAGIFSACAMSFAHTMGEFGVVMMIGGHKQGETLVASIAIYDELETLNYTLAHQYAFTLFILSFAILLSLYFVNKKLNF